MWGPRSPPRGLTWPGSRRAGESGELFGLYATTGRAVSFLAPALFTLCIAIAAPLVEPGEAQRWGILGIMAVLLAPLLLLLPVKAPDKTEIAVVPAV